MPDYAAQWTTAWAPYRAYGIAPGTDASIKIVVEEVEKLTLGPNLKLLNTYFEEIEAYRNVCRELHKQPTNPQILKDVERIERGLTQNSNFIPQIQKCLEECAKAAEAFSLAGAAIKRDTQHTGLVRTVLTTLKDLSTRLTADLGLYGKKMIQTLEAIRRNP